MRTSEDLTAQDAAVFWSKVDKSGGPDACWPARGEVLPKCEHIRIRINYRRYQAHRLAWFFTHGSIPGGLNRPPGSKELLVEHECNTPACCNPAHLKLGTNSSNTTYMHRCGRHKIRRRKLSPEKVEEARRLRRTMSLQEVADHFGVAKSTMSVALRGKTWSE